MPYMRYNGYKRRYGRRKRRYRRKRYTLRKTVKAVKKLRSAAEVKSLDVQGVVPVVGTTPAQTTLNSISVGTSEEQRIGQSVKLIGIHFKWALKIPQVTSEADKDSIVRIVIVKSRMVTDTAPPSFATIFETVDSAAQPILPFYAMKKMEQRKIHKVLADWKVPMGVLGSSNNGGAGFPTMYGERFIRLASKMQFDGIFTGIAQNRIQLFVMDAFEANPEGTCLDFQSRVYYTDS